MRYSVELKKEKYIPGFGFLAFAKNSATNLSSEIGQGLLDHAKSCRYI